MSAIQVEGPRVEENRRAYETEEHSELKTLMELEHYGKVLWGSVRYRVTSESVECVARTVDQGTGKPGEPLWSFRQMRHDKICTFENSPVGGELLRGQSGGTRS